MIKRMNRKAQREVSLGTFLLVLLGIGGLLLVGWGFYKYWKGITSPAGDLNIDAGLMEQKCSYSVLSPSSYCFDPFEAGNNQYVNCPYAVSNLGVELTDGKTAPSCSEPEKAICKKLNLEGKHMDKVSVNARLCSKWVSKSCVAKVEDTLGVDCVEAEDKETCDKFSEVCSWEYNFQ